MRWSMLSPLRVLSPWAYNKGVCKSLDDWGICVPLPYQVASTGGAEAKETGFYG